VYVADYIKFTTNYLHVKNVEKLNKDVEIWDNIPCLDNSEKGYSLGINYKKLLTLQRPKSFTFTRWKTSSIFKIVAAFLQKTVRQEHLVIHRHYV